MMERTLLFHFFICCFLFFYSSVNADDVPAVLWNIKGNSLSVKPAPAFDQYNKYFENHLKTLVNDNTKILAFTMDKLSSEDFLAIDQPAASNSTIKNLQNFLDTTPYTYMSSVNNPLSQLHKLHCGVQEIVVDQNINSKIIQSAFTESCVVILHITDSGVFASKETAPEDAKNFFMPTFSSDSTKSVVGLFTADKTSWSGSNSEHHHSRRVLQSEEAAVEDPHFVNITGCIYFYLNNATVQMGKGNESISLPLPPDTTGSSCNNESSSAVLQLTFKPSGDISTVVLNFNFTKALGSWTTDVTITLTGKSVPESELPTYNSNIGAGLGYSFNCGKLRLITKNKTDVTVTMDGFQVQPFPRKDKFDESFDCVPFFTVPIWMGVFISLLFIIIVNTGVYALFSVHTMDRFDDPKGKTITVGISGD